MTTPTDPHDQNSPWASSNDAPDFPPNVLPHTDHGISAVTPPAPQPPRMTQPPVTAGPAAPPALGEPVLGVPVLGTPTLGTPTLGTPTLGTTTIVPPVPPTATPPTRRKGPGWFAMAGSTLAAAAIASGMTLTLVNLNPSPTAASSGTNQTAVTRVIQGDSSNPDWSATAAAASPSVVSIQVSSSQGTAEGSGVIWDSTGHIVTNHHVATALGQDATIEVTLSNGRIYRASIVGTDSSTDLAVLQLQNAPSDLTPITPADINTVTVGDPVMAVGNPLGLSETVTTGIVSALNRPVITQQDSQSGPGTRTSAQTATQSITNAIQTNAAINPGNSGGALVNANGELIGITSSIASLSSNGTSGNIGIGFAIPINEVATVATQLITNGTAAHAWLGVSSSDAQAATDSGTVNGAQVEEVTAGSPAANANIAAGDVITQVNGVPVTGAESLMALVRSFPVGQQLEVVVVRNGQAQTITVNLGTAPA